MQIRKIFPFVRPHRWWLVTGIVSTVVGVSAAMLPPYLVRIIIDDVIRASVADGEFSTRWRTLALLLSGIAAATTIRATAIYGKSMLIETFSQRVMRDLRQTLFDHVQSLSFHFFHKTRTGELMARFTADMEMIRTLLVMGTVQGSTGVLYVLVSSVILFTINWKLALISVAAAPVLFLVTFRFRAKIHPLFVVVRAQFSKLNAVVQETISGIRVVQSLFRQDFERDRFGADNRALSARRDNAVEVWAVFMPVIEFLSGISAVLVLLGGGWMVIRGDISLGVWVQFNGYLWMVVMPMRMLGEVVNQYSLADASAERVFEVLETQPVIEDSPNSLAPPAIRGEVEFRNVSWSAEGQEILSDISFHVRPGATIAIMGATGSGKSSLVHLIPRFYDPASGQVLIDGEDARMISLPLLRANVGLVAQETFLFSETMYNNLTYGRRGAPAEFVQRVASQTQAHEFINSMTEGYDTVVGERGVGLSGGQRQRTSIARTLLKEAPILILDDATSAVDMETEALIQRAVRNLDHRVTTFIVAHRISSVRHADEIMVLDGGRIVERGSHEELLALGGEYAGIYELQYQDAAEMGTD